MSNTPKIEKIKVLPQVKDLADEVGTFMEFWGFKKVHGQIWTHLAISNRPLHATEIRQRLGLSKALISITLADLKEYGVVYEAGTGERGRTLYLPRENVFEAILNVVQQRELRLINRIETAHRLLAKLPKTDTDNAGISVRRLKFMGEFIHEGMHAMDGFLKLARFSLDKTLEIPSVSGWEKNS